MDHTKRRLDDRGPSGQLLRQLLGLLGGRRDGVGLAVAMGR
jgi:hypothetical protein